MKRTYAFCCNDNEKLLLSTPVVAAGQALSYTSSDFDGSELSMGIRFKVSDNTSGFLVDCTQTDGTKNWSLFFFGDNYLSYEDGNNGRIQLFEVTEGIVYHVWIDIDADDLDVYWQAEGGSSNYQNTEISTNTSSDSMIHLGTNFSKDDPLIGTLWDFAYSTAKNSSAITYIPGGCNFAWTYYWPMREGSGAACTDVIQGVGLTVTTGSSWTGDDTDDPRRWA